MRGRIGIMRALNRHVERVFNPDRKDHEWGRRKAGAGLMPALDDLGHDRKVPSAASDHPTLCGFAGLRRRRFSSRPVDGYPLS
jgi:hypothetical protein